MEALEPRRLLAALVITGSNNTTVATIRLWDGTDFWFFDWERGLAA